MQMWIVNINCDWYKYASLQNLYDIAYFSVIQKKLSNERLILIHNYFATIEVSQSSLQ